MKYAKPPFPVPLFKRFMKLAKKLGYTARGERWTLLGLLFDHAEREPDSFRKR